MGSLKDRQAVAKLLQLTRARINNVNGQVGELSFVWLGDLSGWEFVPVNVDGGLGVLVHHRCGYCNEAPPDGINGVYAANTVEFILTRCQHSCQEYMRRWSR